jgi:hypothetical protein
MELFHWWNVEDYSVGASRVRFARTKLPRCMFHFRTKRELPQFHGLNGQPNPLQSGDSFQRFNHPLRFSSEIVG